MVCVVVDFEVVVCVEVGDVYLFELFVICWCGWYWWYICGCVVVVFDYWWQCGWFGLCELL